MLQNRKTQAHVLSTLTRRTTSLLHELTKILSFNTHNLYSRFRTQDETAMASVSLHRFDTLVDGCDTVSQVLPTLTLVCSGD